MEIGLGVRSAPEGTASQSGLADGAFGPFGGQGAPDEATKRRAQIQENTDPPGKVDFAMLYLGVGSSFLVIGGRRELGFPKMYLGAISG